MMLRRPQFRLRFQYASLVSRTAVPALFALVCVMLAPAAQAFCVNNATPIPLDVFAGQCSTCLKETLMPGVTTCCPAEEERCQGQYLTFKDTKDDDVWAWSDCSAKIPATGSAVLYMTEEGADGSGTTAGEPDAGVQLNCRVTTNIGELVEDGIVSPSRTCPEKEGAPLAC